MTEKDNDFINPANYCICENVSGDDDIKVRHLCHSTGKYRGFGHKIK